MNVDFTRVAMDLMSQLGYTGMSIGLILDSFGIPIPSEVLLAVGGALAATGRFELWLVFGLGTVAQLIGAMVGYWIGRYGGYPFLERYGKYVFISKHDLKRTHEAFEKYGPLITMLGRCIPVIRGLIAYPAGIAGMRFDKFILYSTIGAAGWSAVFVTLGYVLGDNLEMINPYMHELSLIVMVLLILAAGWHFRRHLSKIKVLKPRRRGRGEQ